MTPNRCPWRKRQLQKYSYINDRSKPLETYIFKSVFGELTEQVQETQKGEPRAPEQHLVDVLDVYDAKHEDELVEDKIPKFVFQVLAFGHSQLTEHQLLDASSKQDQPAKSHVDHCLK